MTTFKIHTSGEDAEASTVTFVSNGALVTLQSDHPNFKRVVHALVEGNDPTEFIDVFKAVTQVSDRVTVTDHEVFFDGDPIANGVTRTILRYRAEGREADNLVKFLERVQLNPSRHSREQLWNWVQNRDLTVAEDGRIVAWKSVEVITGEYQLVETEEEDEYGEPLFESRWVEFEEPTYRSHSSGTAWVNGVEHTGQIPYAVGDIVTIPRELVEDDPSRGCSHGLHVGSFDYAKSFGSYRSSKILEVALAPEDVVSVPNDSQHQKLRCAQFEVLAVQERPQEDLAHWEPKATWDDEAAGEDVVSFGETEVEQTFLGKLWKRFRVDS